MGGREREERHIERSIIICYTFLSLVSLESSHISREQPLATKYRLSPLSADPVTPTQEEAWSEIVKDILRTLCSSVDEWGYLMKGEINKDGSLHLLYSNDEGHNVSLLLYSG